MGFGDAWPMGPGGAGGEEPETELALSWNKKNMQKWEKDEPHGDLATISPVLYCNINHPELKTQYPGNHTATAT